ncbi:hypothetical protein CH063_15337 [Colletotrichum higginsianum]|uniref:Uncharacterized protein n=1 Tax=Colletotrichum higginsianum (strain IMI 349063) TaxID=759273 RepID=H1W2E2_COLHI|nr:hypothetical protein CH063_15337 [Colletotrichum higginsianum]
MQNLCFSLWKKKKTTKLEGDDAARVSQQAVLSQPGSVRQREVGGEREARRMRRAEERPSGPRLHAACSD